MDRVLITGITGFAGSHLADYVLREHPEWQLHGTRRWSSRMDKVWHIEDEVRWHDCDLTDPASVRATLIEVHPDRIFHLAAQSYVSPSWRMPSIYVETNVTGTINLLEGARHIVKDARIHIAGSGEEYGLVHPEECPITEDNPLRPVNPYAVTKVAQGMMADVYHRSYEQDIVRTRAFNHIGPRRDNVFAIASFAAQIVACERGRTPPIIWTGCLDATRDFLDVQDVARAYWLALEYGAAGGLYCVGSGTGVKIEELLTRLCALATVDNIVVRQDPNRVRPTEVPLLVTDSTHFRKATGWTPKIPLDDTLADIMEYWRAQ